jgi:hypothetical protein
MKIITNTGFNLSEDEWTILPGSEYAKEIRIIYKDKDITKLITGIVVKGEL